MEADNRQEVQRGGRGAAPRSERRAFGWSWSRNQRKVNKVEASREVEGFVLMAATSGVRPILSVPPLFLPRQWRR